ncbi:hypothetical protein DN752_21530 [Echinicola strongylocentroti]|uniref:Uncharacterized protein n=1 Tax=Echinicola strongylocentroti TaxID=1795355 RepID=A0A2Z4IQE5_9BACT|nr:hypothetical protein DN752_21530 [Echinicola strongylocentroti]
MSIGLYEDLIKLFVLSMNASQALGEFSLFHDFQEELNPRLIWFPQEIRSIGALPQFSRR